MYKSNNQKVTITGNKAGYEYLLAYKITVPIYDLTVEFCHLFFRRLSSARTQDQMVQAARSGLTNIAEGYKQKSLAGYIKLTGVSLGSLEELLKDYLAFARQNKIAIWDQKKAKGEIREIREIWEILNKGPLPNSPSFPTLPTLPETAVNLMVTLIKQATYLQQKLLASLEKKHEHEGGFSENLFRKRLEYKRSLK